MRFSIHIQTQTFEKYYACTEPTDDRTPFHTETVVYSVLAVNEVMICTILRKILCYPCFFSLLEKYEKVETTQKTPISRETYLFFYSNEPSVDLVAFLGKSTDAKQLFSKMLDSLPYLLQALQELEQNNICFFQLSPQNIVFASEKPVLKGFRVSLQVSKLSVAYIVPILVEANLLRLPLEVHLLHEILVKNKDVVISPAFIESFCLNFVESLLFLKMFSPLYKQKYQAECVKSLQKYVDVNQNDVIADILGKHTKWDIYSLSLLFLEIFACMQRVFSLKGTITSKIIAELIQNIHPDPEQRGNITDTIRTLERILEEQDLWSDFAKKIDNHRLPMFWSALLRYV